MNCEVLILITYCVFAYAQYNVTEFNKGEPTRCDTPRLEQGRCVPIQECPLLLNMIPESTRRPEVFNYLQESHCDSLRPMRSPKVCCPKQKTSESQPPGNSSTTASPIPATEGPHDNRNLFDHPNLRLLPENCGVSFGERIFGGDKTALGEYPWMAILEYTSWTDGGKEFLCGGSLISKRYVLTAAHCISPPEYKLTGVILGDHNTATNPDCQTDDFGESFCQPACITMGVETAIMHPDYELQSGDQKNDIGLIRLNSSVFLEDFSGKLCQKSPFCTEITHRLFQTDNVSLFSDWCAQGRGLSDGRVRISVVATRVDQKCPSTRLVRPAFPQEHGFARRMGHAVPVAGDLCKSHIRPICFPRDELLTKDYVGDTGVVAGWGTTETSRNRSNVLQDVVLPVVDIEDCANMYARRRNVGTTQICAGGEPNKDSCSGDSGGPLMVADCPARNSDKHFRFFVVGVLSYGPNPCGSSGWHSVYTKVGAYAKWILDTMRA